MPPFRPSVQFLSALFEHSGGLVNKVEKESGSTLLSGDDYLFLFRLSPHSLFQFNSSSNVLTFCTSFVSDPSVHQP
jgi:hypothetical protein